MLRRVASFLADEEVVMSEQLQWSAELDRLTGEIDQLKKQLAAQTGGHPVSRRGLLMAAPVAAVAGAVATLAAYPTAARAATGDPLLLGRANDASGATTQLSGGSRPGTPALAVTGGLTSDSFGYGSPYNNGIEVGAPDTDAMLYAHNEDNTLVAHFVAFVAPYQAAGGNDLVRITPTGPGTGLTVDAHDKVYAQVDGTVGRHTCNAVVITAQTGAAVAATVTDGSAFAATVTGAGHALTASSSSATTASDAVTIDYAGTSRALYAQSHNPTNINGTLTGVNEGHGIGVWGEQRNNTGPGIGVVGVGGAQGRGSQFTGGVAQTRLVPSTASTHPSTGKAGDLFVDKSVRLWFCTKSSSGSTAATWKQIA